MRKRRTSSVREADVVDRFWLTGLNPYFSRMESMIWGKLATGMLARRTMGMWMGSPWGWGAARAHGRNASARKESIVSGAMQSVVYSLSDIKDNAGL